MTTAPYAFADRHIGPGDDDVRAMLARIGVPSVDALIDQAVPKSIRLDRPLNLPAPATEAEALEELSATMSRNTVMKSFIGAGYHSVQVPPVIQRNMFENPAWYTAYTPYQAEISQGRLEMLFNFQTLVSELTGLPVASASLLDEATAAAEAVGIAVRHHRDKRNKIALAGVPLPQTLDVLHTRAEPLDIEIDGATIDDDTAALIVSWPDANGVYGDHKAAIEKAKAAGALVIFISDPLSLTVTSSPASLGADIAVGSMQRFGVPMGFGGPHAAYCAVSDKLTRLMPGRLVGQSVDAHGRPGYRLALQTREQHIRRDKATSNICTAQALLANMATAYAIWHGPAGLQAMASRIHALANGLAEGLAAAGVKVLGSSRFDTVTAEVNGKAGEIAAAAEQDGRLLRVIDADHVSIAFDETSTEADLDAIAALFEAKARASASNSLPGKPRGSEFLTQPVFHENRSETDMMRFLRRLADKDLALDRAMIPLGSCTMKLNAAAEMMPVSWPNLANLHPFAPRAHSAGIRDMIAELEGWLAEITGFDAVTLQPNAGSQGEYAGLLAIRGYHKSRGEGHRNICLIPSSAHGTNPASAAMAGMSVVVVRCCTDDGNIDIDDLKAKAEQHGANLAALMFTYPSTHGVFEEGAKDICAIVHGHGGQVYFDGANLNALVGLARPGDIGADVCHMNLHKTFCIPHGGGGPGVGPIGVKSHLAAHLPGHVAEGSAHAVSAAPFGSASILPITWMYIRMMGPQLKKATEIAILSANYLVARLGNHYSVLYRGRGGRVAHECILDTRVLKDRSGITVDDIAKRLIDYGFHAPTMSFPVAGTLMVEPTESEPKAEVDRLCEALIAIADEAAKVEKGEWPAEDNPLVNAPHTAAEALAGKWTHPYSRMEAAFPAGNADMLVKYWPPVSRIDNVAGDRNLICSCPPVSEYSDAAE